MDAAAGTMWTSSPTITHVLPTMSVGVDVHIDPHTAPSWIAGFDMHCRGNKDGPRTPPHKGGPGGHGLAAGGSAICGWRFGTMGDFAPCAAREFRPLRRATGALPLDPTIFL